MFNAIRKRIRHFAPAAAQPPGNRDARVQLRLPSPYGGKPWLTATLALSSTAHGQGETLRLQAHVDGCLRLPDSTGARQGLGHASRRTGSLAGCGRAVATSLVRGAVNRVPAARLAPLTARRWRSWLDVQLSTAPLDAGADALMPEQLRGLCGDRLLRTSEGEPRIAVWSGPAGGVTGGVACLALLQLDERDVRLGKRERSPSGFNINASMAQVVESDSGGDDGDRSFGAN